MGPSREAVVSILSFQTFSGRGVGTVHPSSAISNILFCIKYTVRGD